MYSIIYDTTFKLMQVECPFMGSFILATPDERGRVGAQGMLSMAWDDVSILSYFV